MTAKLFDPRELQKLARRPPSESRQEPSNGIGTATPERVKEAVREANDPKRLISDPQNFSRPRS